MDFKINEKEVNENSFNKIIDHIDSLIGANQEYKNYHKIIDYPFYSIYILWWMESEILNGGIEQFLTNSTGVFIKDIPKALEYINYLELKSLFTQINKDLEKNNLSVEELNEVWVDNITNKYHNICENNGYIKEYVLRFIKNNKSQYIN